MPDGPGTVVWDPLAPGYATDPYPQFAALREAAPVHHLGLTQSWLVTRYEDVREMQRERTMSVRIQNATRTPAVEAELALIEAQGGRGRTSMLRQDGEDHTRLRRLVSRAFTPKAVKAWRERTEEIVDRLLDEGPQVRRRVSSFRAHAFATGDSGGCRSGRRASDRVGQGSVTDGLGPRWGSGQNRQMSGTTAMAMMAYQPMRGRPSFQ